MQCVCIYIYNACDMYYIYIYIYMARPETRESAGGQGTDGPAGGNDYQ